LGPRGRFRRCCRTCGTIVGVLDLVAVINSTRSATATAAASAAGTLRASLSGHLAGIFAAARDSVVECIPFAVDRSFRRDNLLLDLFLDITILLLLFGLGFIRVLMSASYYYASLVRFWVLKHGQRRGYE